MIPFQCTVPSGNPSGGTCVTTGPVNDAGSGVECNPVTNAGCTGSDACDTNLDNGGNVIGFVCFSPTGAAFTDALCNMCDDSTDALSCPAGQTCFGFCARYCCTDADCGSGHCAAKDTSNMPLFGTVAPNLGVCIL
jgi:hypothetical protein